MTNIEWEVGRSFLRREDEHPGWRLIPDRVRPEDLEPLMRFMQLSNTSFMIEVLLYGIHVVLFALCCFVLTSRQKRVQWFVLGCALALFALSTADVAYTMRCNTSDLPALFQPMDWGKVDKRIKPKPAMFVTNKYSFSKWPRLASFSSRVLTRGFQWQFHRCYVIWGRPKLLLVIALVCLTADTMWGWLMVGLSSSEAFRTLQPMYLWSVFALNVVVTAASVGRIYWVTVFASPQIERGMKKVYRTIMSAFVESAAVYTASILAYLVWSRKQPMGSSMVMLSVVQRLVAIMPTLMIVQVAFSHQAGPFTRDVENGRGGEAPVTDSVILDTIITRGGPLDSSGSYPLRWAEQLDNLNHHDKDDERTSTTSKEDIIVVEVQKPQQ
ncbi:hypothetical protein D9611_009164 [Ephemerocybe angulata]|uniref:Uncharacterized protein n=1 Tax=Ephemerocybe angulata TaxID=980116 RepID=A0A8H5CEM6_9AGAR|nr:hypothetical protein D9611_009164 [Tulosesus angulatus]